MLWSIKTTPSSNINLIGVISCRQRQWTPFHGREDRECESASGKEGNWSSGVENDVQLNCHKLGCCLFTLAEINWERWAIALGPRKRLPQYHRKNCFAPGVRSDAHFYFLSLPLVWFLTSCFVYLDLSSIFTFEFLGLVFGPVFVWNHSVLGSSDIRHLDPLSRAFAFLKLPPRVSYLLGGWADSDAFPENQSTAVLYVCYF